MHTQLGRYTGEGCMCLALSLWDKDTLVALQHTSQINLRYEDQTFRQPLAAFISE